MQYKTIISHPREKGDDTRLEEHLCDVESRMLQLGQFSDDGECSERKVASVIARLHDFGKVTPAFQAKIRREYTGKPQFTYHARIGALAAYWVITELGGEKRDALAGFAAISRHHGVLPDFTSHLIEDVYRTEADSEENVKAWATAQARAIDDAPVHARAANDLLVAAGSERTTWDRFSDAMADGEVLESLADAVSTQVGFGERNTDPELLPAKLYDRTLRYWGTLTLADKTSAAGIELAALERKPLSVDELDQYIATLEATNSLERDLNELRESARQEVRANAIEKLLETDADVGRITLPTGLGKTFTGITAAFELRARIQERRDLEETPTVVYALPFTSIIEQTRELFEDPGLWDADPAGSAFTVHHYLSETVTRVDTEQADTGAPESDRGMHPDAMLGESWRAGTVLTTFVQLFESVAGPTNSRGLKLPALQDAVIVLDEPQALPKRWWKAVPRLVELLSEEFDATVIAMTATQPAIFDGDDELQTVELIDEVGGYYENVQRVRYTIDESVWNLNDTEAETTPIDHETAGRRIVEAVTNGKELDQDPSPTSALAVCNTIASSRRLTETVRAAAPDPALHLGQIYRSVLANENGDDAASHVDDLAAAVLMQIGLVPEGNENLLDNKSVTDIQWTWEHSGSPPFVVATFNSRYRPKDRRVLIRLAEVLTSVKGPFVFVSTQAVEAGVDLSFAQVFRDVAPLDSIVQAAGRCNRSFEWGREGGRVTVWLLADPDDPEGGLDQTPTAHVYNSDVGGHLSLVAQTLHETLPTNTDVDEVHLTRNAVPAYFDALQHKAIASQSLRDHIDRFEAATLGKASLIQEDYPTVDAIVAITDHEQQLLDSIGDAFDNGNLPKAYQLLQAMSDLRISIPAQDADRALSSIPRVDRKERSNPEGVRVLAFRAGDFGGNYELDRGGFIADDDDLIGGRFTT